MEQRIQPLPFETMAPAMALALTANFGSVERWQQEFVTMADALDCRPGCVVLAFNPDDGSLVNLAAADHAHAIAGGVPILAFMRNIDWKPVYEKYQAAVYAASESLAAEQYDASGATLLDVRRAGTYQQADKVIAGASWRDPAGVAEWAASLPKEKPVIVYCVYGHEVGRATALRLHAQGVQARFLRGGIDAWQAAGLPLADKAR